MTHFNKVLLVTLVVLLAAISIHLFPPQVSSVSFNEPSSIDDANSMLGDSNLEKSQAVVNVEEAEVITAQTGAFQSEDEPTSSLSESLAQKDMWQLSPRAQEELERLGYIPPNIADERYVDVEIEKFMALEQEEAFEFEIPQLGRHFTATVQENSEPQDGVRTLRAVIPSEDRPLNVLISYSDDSIVGEVSTPSGDYLIEGTEQYAWLAPRQSMAANTRPDVEIMDNLDPQVSDERPKDLPLSL